MVGIINSAFAERERVRQLLLADADIVVTEEKKALLEERRRSWKFTLHSIMYIALRYDRIYI